MASRPQAPQSIFEAGEKLFEHTAKAIQILEGAARGSPVPIPTACQRCGEPYDEHPHAQQGDPRGWHCKDRPCADCLPETRECENCGKQKPIEEMETVFLPGTGESYQCETCRGVTP